MQEKENEKVIQQRLENFRHVCKSKAGKDILAWLMEECGFLQSSTMINRQTGELAKNNTEHNEGRRSVYLQIRPYIPREVRMEIENPLPPPQVPTPKTEVDEAWPEKVKRSRTTPRKPKRAT